MVFVKSYFDRCSKILSCIEESPKSVKKISEETKIPITTVYQIIRKLDGNDMLLKRGMVINGAKSRFFQAKEDPAFVRKKLNELFPDFKKAES